MMKHNPVFIPRNHKVEEALSGYLKIKKPYSEDVSLEEFTKPAPAIIFCG